MALNLTDQIHSLERQSSLFALPTSLYYTYSKYKVHTYFFASHSAHKSRLDPQSHFKKKKKKKKNPLPARASSPLLLFLKTPAPRGSVSSLGRAYKNCTRLTFLQDL